MRKCSFKRFDSLFASFFSVSVFNVTIERANFELTHRYMNLALTILIRLYGAANYIVVFRIFVWLFLSTNMANFWYRKRRIIFLPKRQKYFVLSLNVYPKLQCLFLVDAVVRTRSLGTIRKSVSSHARLRISCFYLALEQLLAAFLFFHCIEIKKG